MSDEGPTDDPADLVALARHADALVTAVEAALPGWVERVVAERWAGWSAEPLPTAVREAAAVAGRQSLARTGPALRDLLGTDVDRQRSNPLALIRTAVAWPTAVLAGAGVPPVERDPEAERLFPDDVYDLTPASFAALDPSVHEPGLVWGAAKAHVILRRRKYPRS